MYKGDISNSMPKRVLVVDDLVVLKRQKVTKKYKILPVVKTEVEYDRIMLNKLYQFTTREGITLELISFDMDQDKLEVLYEALDKAGTNPFRYYSAYKSPRELVSDLPFRPEVAGVFDPAHQLMYGHWGLDL